MTLDFQQELPFAPLRFGLTLLRFALCIAVERTHKPYEHRRNRMEDYFLMLNVRFKKVQIVQKVQKTLFVLF